MTESLEIDQDGAAWLVCSHAVLQGETRADIEPRLEALKGLAGEEHAIGGLRMRVPPELGTGLWEIIPITKHLILMLGECEYHDDFLLPAQDDNTLKIRVLLSGKLRAPQQNVVMEGTGAFLEAFPSKTSSEYILEAGLPTRLVILVCKPAFFREDLQVRLSKLPQPIAAIVDDTRQRPIGGVTPLGPDILRASNDILRSAKQFAPSIRRAYYAAKAQELTCTMIADLDHKSAKERSTVPFSVRDVNRIYEARDILDEQFQRPPTIPQLARTIGVNQTKLKALFKATFNMTVHDYTQKCRMERASDLLTVGGMGISEVAYAIGYDYPANFSSAFKKYYGHAPRQFRKAAGEADPQQS